MVMVDGELCHRITINRRKERENREVMRRRFHEAADKRQADRQGQGEQLK
jgi:hypothetical protein